MDNRFIDIIQIIRQSRSDAIRIINAELINLYSNIGEYISMKLLLAEWGYSVVTELAKYIQQNEPDIKGFSDKNLWRMKQFYETYKDYPKISTLLREISWSHNLAIFSRCKSSEEREFYLKLSKQESYSFRELDRQISASLFERTMIGNTKLSTALREANSNISNIFKENELDRQSVVAKYATTASDGKTYQVDYFNLDVIISIGYRVKSQRGTQFRIWANKILKEYLIKGYSINENALRRQNEQLVELQKTIKILSSAVQSKELTSDESKGLLSIISDYSYALDILDQYDYQTLSITETSGKDIYRITYAEAIGQINLVRKAYGNSDLFGREKDKSFKSSISTTYKTFDGNDLYPSIEEKAA